MKLKPFRSKKLRDSARGQVCTVAISGVCNRNTETTVLAHMPDETGTGKMGGKSHDYFGVFACSDCHDALDGRVKNSEQLRHFKEFYMRRALQRTLQRWVEMGLGSFEQ